MIAMFFADQTVLSIILCVVQVTLLAVIGTLATRWLIPRRPEMASTVSCAAVAVILLLTIAVPFSVPRCLVFDMAVNKEVSAIGEIIVENRPAVQETRRSSAISSGANAGWMTDIPGLMQRVALRLGSAPESARSVSIPSVGLVLLGLGVVVGCTRFALSVATTWALSRRSCVLNDDRALQYLFELCSKLKIRQSVKLLESNAISSAAVCGSIRPQILLPADWHEWSDAELRSVLAHELAHIAKGDFAWRAISATASAIHFFNPFVHQLVQSMVLAQELTADVSAAEAVERATYIRSLSVLALRRDQSDVGCSRVGISPVFSGYLIKRINMLYSKEDFGMRRTSDTMRLVVAGAVIACGMAVFTIRGYAEPPMARIARASSRPASAVDPIAGLFLRKSVDAADIGENKVGMFEIRMADLMGHKDINPLVAIANRGLAGELKSYFGLNEAPQVDLQSIDVIYGSAQVAVRQGPEESQSRMMFGVGSSPTRVKFVEPVDAASWINKHVPGAVTKHAADVAYLELPEIPALGPAPLYVKHRDPMTVCIGSLYRSLVEKNELEIEKRTKESLEKALAKPQFNPSGWAKPFDQVKGGLMTFACSNDEVQIPEKFDTGDRTGIELECSRIVHRMLHTFDTFAMGLDINEHGTRFGLRVHVSASDEARQEILFSDVQSLSQIARRHYEISKTAVDQEIEDPELRELCLDFMRQFLDHLIVERVDDKNGLPYVAIRSDIEIPSLGILIASLISADADLP